MIFQGMTCKIFKFLSEWFNLSFLYEYSLIRISTIWIFLLFEWIHRQFFLRKTQLNYSKTYIIPNPVMMMIPATNQPKSWQRPILKIWNVNSILEEFIKYEIWRFEDSNQSAHQQKAFKNWIFLRNLEAYLIKKIFQRGLNLFVVVFFTLLVFAILQDFRIFSLIQIFTIQFE